MPILTLIFAVDKKAVFIKESTMSNDYRQLFLSGKGADVHIMIDTHCIPCHKSILMARCEYFKARFNVTWDKPKITAPITDGIQVVKIDDLEYGAVRTALEFIYCDFVQLSWENAVDMLGTIRSLLECTYEEQRSLLKTVVMKLDIYVC